METIGNYKIIREIGKGGFAKIYEAEHRILGEKVSLKRNINENEKDVDLLKYEAKLLWRLDECHSIPSVKDFFLINNLQAAMVLSYIDGNTLEEIVQHEGPIHPEDCCWITERLLGALCYIHYNGVVHADVKPQNVFVEPNKHDIKLIDFGTAAYRPGKNAAARGFTPKYAAPELILGNPPIPETDIYGAGLVLLRALGGNLQNKTFRSDTPKEIADFCKNMLNPDLKQRPNWEKENLIEELSDIREKVFGRRHSINQTNNVKGGT
jgi:serine/threonine protein kinase